MPLHPFLFRGGPLLHQPSVQAVFWGAGWRTRTTTTVRLTELLDLLIRGPFMITLNQYGISRGRSDPPITLLGTPPLDQDGLLTDDVLKAELARLARLNPGPLAPLTPERLYVVFLPPGTQISNADGVSGQDFSAYHAADTSDFPDVYYAVLPVPAGNISAMLKTVTPLLSHELIDSVTDPVPGTGWVNDQGLEVADTDKTRLLGPLTVSRHFNKDGSIT